MRATPSKIESSLVSIAGVLARLGRLCMATDWKDDFSIPKAIKGQLVNAEPTLQRIVDDVHLAQKQVVQDAQELLTAWAASVGIQVGDSIRFEGGYSMGRPLKVRAFVKELSLDYNATARGTKHVIVLLEGMCLTMPDGSELTDSKNENLLMQTYKGASPLFSAVRPLRDAGTGAKPVLSLRIPIKQADRESAESRKDANFLKFL